MSFSTQDLQAVRKNMGEVLAQKFGNKGEATFFELDLSREVFDPRSPVLSVRVGDEIVQLTDPADVSEVLLAVGNMLKVSLATNKVKQPTVRKPSKKSKEGQ
jgi:hypothetical protein